MFDPFDAFDPIDPVPAPTPAPEAQRVEDVEGVEVEAAAEPVTPDHAGHDDTAGLADPTPARDAAAPPDASEAHRPERRWVAYPHRAPQAGSMGVRTRRDERTESEASSGAGPERPTPPRFVSPEDVATLRTMTVPALRAATERLRARGHDTVLVEALDADEPTVTVLLKPDPGPLVSAAAAGHPARFDIRVQLAESGPRVLTTMSASQADGSTIPLDEAPLAEVDATWVGHRFIEFVQRSLASS